MEDMTAEISWLRDIAAGERVEVEKKAAESGAFLGNRQQYQSILRQSFNIHFQSACVGGGPRKPDRLPQ